MAETVTCKALVAFTQFVSGYGMVHGDPDSSDKAATHPAIPVEEVARFVKSELVKAPKGFIEEADAAAATEAEEVAAAELAIREEDAAKDAPPA